MKTPSPQTSPSASPDPARARLEFIDRLAKEAHAAMWGPPSGRATYDRVWNRMGNAQREGYRRIVRQVVAAAALEPKGLECLKELLTEEKP